MSTFERTFPGGGCTETHSPEGLNGSSREIPPYPYRHPALLVRNMEVKKAMSRELIAQGLSQESIDRILNLER